MSLFSRKKIVVTHNRSFHADDVFAVATLSLLHAGNIKVVRTRDEKMFSKADYVLDVGGVYNPEKNRFDHHQEGGAGERSNGISYASFGLIWKKFGIEVCGNSLVAEAIDKKLVQPIDAVDNGVVSGHNTLAPEIYSYIVNDIIASFNPTWKEGDGHDSAFFDAVHFAKAVLQREIIQARDRIEASGFVEEAYKDALDKRIIVLQDGYPWKQTLALFLEPLFVVYPIKGEGKWGVSAVPVSEKVFKNKKDFPAHWGGKRDQKLVEVSGVSDAIFCHNKLFFAVAKSKEGALALANKALNE